MNKLFFSVSITLTFCGQAPDKPAPLVAQGAVAIEKKNIIDEKGTTIQTRFNTPVGFKRKTVKKSSFADYLRNLPLKPAGSKVKYYDGTIKDDYVYDAVVDMDIGNKNLQQCADAVMRLRAEYFYSQKEYDKITFNLTNGFRVDYSEWMKGNRVVVNGNKTWWRKSAESSNTYLDFRNYMDLIFNYAGSLSLSKSLKQKELKNISVGDVFIVGGSPGHAEIVVDVAENNSGEKVFLLAQSYMPAQETQILRNLDNEAMSPWYSTNIAGLLNTPQWSFNIKDLKTWE